MSFEIRAMKADSKVDKNLYVNSDKFQMESNSFWHVIFLTIIY